MTMRGNQVAGDGEVWVCIACGKRSRDRFGMQAISVGWDASCMSKAILCLESSLAFEDGRVSKAQAVGRIDKINFTIEAAK